MTAGLTEAVVEDTALAWLETLGWTIAHSPDIALGCCRNWYRKSCVSSGGMTTIQWLRDSGSQ